MAALARSLMISIVNHNHWDWIQGCLDSIAENPYTLGPCETVVLDNASEDGSIDRIRGRYPAVRVVPKSIRRGFGENQNEVILSTAADLVLVMNPDAVVHRGTLDALVRGFGISSSIVITAGPDTGAGYSRPIDGPFPFPTSARALTRALHLNRDRHSVLFDEQGVVNNGWVSGHAFMVDRRRFNEIGGFDTSYFMYSEEVDLMRRMQDSGWVIGWVDEALTTHIGKTSGESPLRGSKGVERPIAERTVVQFARSEIKYIRTHHGCLRAVTFRAASALDAAIRYAATRVRWVGRRMVAKGLTIEHTRAHHLTRLRVFLGVGSPPDLEDGAREWNIAHGARM